MQAFCLGLMPRSAGGLYFYAAYHDYAGTAPLPASGWFHVALTWDGSSPSMYVNGLPTPGRGVPDGSPSYSETLSTAQSRIWIGGGPTASLLLDDVRIYSSALSAAAVASIALQPCITLSPTRTVSASMTSSASASSSTTATSGLACPPSLFHRLARTDLAGASLTNAPLVVPSEGACRITCCGAPGCDGYAFAFSSCVLLSNVTSTVPNNFAASGLRMGAALPIPSSTRLPQSAGQPRVGSLSPTLTPTSPASVAWDYRVRTNIGDPPEYAGPGYGGPCAILGLPQGGFPWPDRGGSWGGGRCQFSSLTTAQQVCLAAPQCCGVTLDPVGYEPRRSRADGSCFFGTYAEGESPWGVEVNTWLRGAPSRSPSPTLNYYCAPSLFHDLPRMDLVGTLVGTALSPGAPVPLPSLSSCRQACCDAPLCDGYSFASGDMSFISGGSAGCFLYVNITQLIPNSGYSSGIVESTL